MFMVPRLRNAALSWALSSSVWVGNIPELTIPNSDHTFALHYLRMYGLLYVNLDVRLRITESQDWIDFKSHVV